MLADGDFPRLLEIFDSLPDSLLVTDSVGTIVMANPAAAQLIDLPLDRLIGRSVGGLVQDGVYQPSLAVEACRTRQTVSGVIRVASGQTVMSTSVPLLDASGSVRCVVSVSRSREAVDQFIRGVMESEATSSALERYRSELVHLRERGAENKTLDFCSPVMRQVAEKAQIAAGVSCPVLLLGESGVGKDVTANHIHRSSARAREAFIVVNCAAMPEHLIESELFGYDKGAFSGAHSHGKFGLVELADKGTLFLDEIAEIPLSLQAKFLRVLETYEVRRLGSVESRKIDFRLIAATNRDIRDLVARGKFREDLFYRISVFPIKIPPLRERKEDIPALVEAFLGEFNKKYGTQKRVSAEAAESVMSYHWPGNVRELRNVVERHFFSTPGEVIQCSRQQRKPDENLLKQAAADLPALWQGSLKDVLQKVETAYIEQVLHENGGRSTIAAQKLGIHRTVLWRKIREQKH